MGIIIGYYTVFELHQVIDVNTKEVLSEDERLEHATQIENESHFDEEVSFIKVEEYGVYEEIEISFRLDVREEMEIVDGEQTWLYF